MFLEQLLSSLNCILRFPCYVIARRCCVNILCQTSLLLDLDRNGVSMVFSFPRMLQNLENLINTPDRLFVRVLFASKLSGRLGTPFLLGIN